MNKSHVLSESDKAHAVWAKLKEHYEARLENLRRLNDAPKSELKTAALRGRIAEIKELLGMDKSLPETESDDLGDY